MDYDAALGHIEEVKGLFASVNLHKGEGDRALPQLLEATEALRKALFITRGIALELGEPEIHRRLQMSAALRGPLVDLEGTIRARAELSRIIGPKGPQLAASALHPLVWSAAGPLWDNGHHREAVQTAAQALEGILQGRTGRPDVGGANLANTFSTAPPDDRWPRLRIPDLEAGGRAWTTAHEGAGFLIRAAFQYVRNLASHPGSPPLAEEEALEQLAVPSMAARLVDRSELESADPTLGSSDGSGD